MPCDIVNEARDERARSRTRLDDIDTNIFHAGIYLLLHEGSRCDSYVNDPLSILGGKSSGGGHGIAAMCSENLLISFKSAVSHDASALDTVRKAHRSRKNNCAHAPPELSEPAMRRTGRVSILEEATRQVDSPIAEDARRDETGNFMVHGRGCIVAACHGKLRLGIFDNLKLRQLLFDIPEYGVTSCTFP